MKLRDELFELIRDRLAWLTTSISISLPAIIALLLNVRQNPELFYISLYFFVVIFIVINSVYILNAKKTTPDIVVTSAKSLEGIEDSKFEERTVARYPLLQSYARSGLVATFLVTVVLGFVPGVNQTVQFAILGTSTQTPTQTLTLTPSPTFTWTPSPQPESVTHYYMIVLDASINMQESFDGQSKWGAALIALSSMFEALNRNSNYGLVVVGGSSENSGTDPCNEPSRPIIPFVTDEQVFLSRDSLQMEDLITQINQLQPVGGGSLYTAFTLAKQQLDDLPANAVKTLIFITGSSDTCESRNEWRELERIIQLPDLVGLYSEIIILDEDAGLITQNIAERINSLSETVNVQVSENNQQLQQITGIVINQVNMHVKEQQAALENNNPIENVISISPPTSAPPVVVVVPPPTFTAIPPTQVPPTPKPPTSPPQPTNTPTTSVVLLSASYNGSGESCEAVISFQVSGNAATGNFHVWNAFYGPAGDVYPTITLPIGTNGYQVGLGGHPAEYYRHEVWFEYNGTSSNRLTNLVCPGLTPVP